MKYFLTAMTLGGVISSSSPLLAQEFIPVILECDWQSESKIPKDIFFPMIYPRKIFLKINKDHWKLFDWGSYSWNHDSHDKFYGKSDECIYKVEDAQYSLSCNQGAGSLRLRETVSINRITGSIIFDHRFVDGQKSGPPTISEFSYSGKCAPGKDPALGPRPEKPKPLF